MKFHCDVLGDGSVLLEFIKPKFRVGICLENNKAVQPSSWYICGEHGEEMGDLDVSDVLRIKSGLMDWLSNWEISE
jgi:hypothetical protein